MTPGALNRNVLTNVLGARRDVDVHVAEQRLTEATLIILVTDGVHAVVGDRQIAELVSAGDTPAAVARKLVSAALDRGSRDNCTAVVADYRVRP